jgi:hypothetical protein
MDKLVKALSSRTVWTVIVLVALNSVNELKNLFPSEAWVDTVNVVLLALATYFRVNLRS